MATSRALAIEYGVSNVGSLSPLAFKALEKRGLAARDGKRSPQQCAVVDLETADLIVALMDSEHRPLIRERFGDWEDRVEYWLCGDARGRHERVRKELAAGVKESPGRAGASDAPILPKPQLRQGADRDQSSVSQITHSEGDVLTIVRTESEHIA